MRDEIRHCSVCDDTTAHQRRRAPWPAMVGAPLAALGVLASVALLPLGLPVVVLGVWMVAHDRQQRWDIACGRCRARAVARGRWAWMRTTTIVDF